MEQENCNSSVKFKFKKALKISCPSTSYDKQREYKKGEEVKRKKKKRRKVQMHFNLFVQSYGSSEHFGDIHLTCMLHYVHFLLCIVHSGLSPGLVVKFSSSQDFLSDNTYF